MTEEETRDNMELDAPLNGRSGSNKEHSGPPHWANSSEWI